MRVSWKMLFVLSVAAIVAVLGFTPSASAQCSMCRAALAGSNNAFFIRNFNIGVLVLLVPPVTMFCSIFIVLKRSRDHDDDSETRNPILETRNSKPETDLHA